MSFQGSRMSVLPNLKKNKSAGRPGSKRLGKYISSQCDTHNLPYLIDKNLLQKLYTVQFCKHLSRCDSYIISYINDHPSTTTFVIRVVQTYILSRYKIGVHFLSNLSTVYGAQSSLKQNV